MGFSNEWDNVYQNGHHNSIWPWSSVVSLVHHYYPDTEGMKVLEVGCGKGANIPFFLSMGAKYYAIEGSEYAVAQISQTYSNDSVIIRQGDFTQDLLFDEQFDLILDRSALTHNKTDDIIHTIDAVYDHLKIGGIFMGVDWFSKKHDAYVKGTDYDSIDENTRVFRSGYFEGLGNVHFADTEDLKELFSRFRILQMSETVSYTYIPSEECHAEWIIVVQK